MSLTDTFIPPWARWLATAALVAAFAAVFYFWGMQDADIRHDLKDARRDAQEASAVAAITARYRRKEQQWQASSAANDAAAHKETKDAQDKLASLQRTIDRGAVRVFVPARCSAAAGSTQTASAVSGTDGAGTAELSPAFASALAGIAGDADRLAIKISHLQDYIQLVCLVN
ncbi:lysis system i-spanin subunit Rz [Silvimonas sp.]|uniref:lysis system i-spanin subunit Rz n=1 Tax=Silvimonas sp. TaxID=2650811 RepID=UPI0028436786|nr:lysis system i-spanin subunit Rz [Silvimonas sp.]MDR3427911.1 lysis system i-spanin subunit Rz [Silvimonas sp.]